MDAVTTTPFITEIEIVELKINLNIDNLHELVCSEVKTDEFAWVMTFTYHV